MSKTAQTSVTNDDESRDTHGDVSHTETPRDTSEHSSSSHESDSTPPKADAQDSSASDASSSSQSEQDNEGDEHDDTTDLAPSDSVDLALPDADEDLNSEDSLTFSNGVIEKIVALAVRDVPGVLGMKGGFLTRVQETFSGPDPTKGVSVEMMPDNSMRVNISVLIEYGSYAPQVFEDVKKVVVKQVVGMTGLDLGGVNLRIEDVVTPEEYERMKKDQDGSEHSASDETE